jgi:transposase
VTSSAAVTIFVVPAPRPATGSGSNVCATGVSTGKRSWTVQHRAWVRRVRLDDPLAQAALEQMLCHLETLDTQLAAVDRKLEQVAATHPWCDPVSWLTCFRGISTLTALGLLAEISDFRRFATPRELMSFLGLTVAECSSGDRQVRGSMTKTGNRHARRLLPP